MGTCFKVVCVHVRLRDRKGGAAVAPAQRTGMRACYAVHSVAMQGLCLLVHILSCSTIPK